MTLCVAAASIRRMVIRFYGAAGEVTGSAYLIETARARVLVDFGMFQGSESRETLNVIPDGLDPHRLDAVLLTHAHLDHTGRLPLLAKSGCKAPVYCTKATMALTALILRDSAKVQAQDIERINRKRRRADEPPIEPSFTAEDVETVLQQFKAVPYDEPVSIAPGVQARWVEAGHMLGSASVQLLFENGGRAVSAAFSGDLGPHGAPILKDAAGFERADIVVLESTYGDRDHRPLAKTVDEFQQIVQEAVQRNGKILVPTFAVGRTQLLIYLLAVMFRRKQIPKFPIYIDSPMAIEASRIYAQHVDLFDSEYHALDEQRPLTVDMDTVQATATAEQSKALNDVPGPCMILAGSGMCTAGRILHHFKQNLWRPETSVIIVGYQAVGTLGRMLVDGAKRVRIFGETIAVKARIHTLGGFSAHAGQSELLKWLEPLATTHPRVILTHGEAKGREPLAGRIRDQHGIQPHLPEYGDAIKIE